MNTDDVRRADRYTIARAHGGSVGYRPDPSNGACFYIVLPAQALD